ncbi:MAG: glycosyltransferase family 2 protein [Acidobacteriota bacterium]
MYRGQSVAVVMPVHNEETHIEPAIKRVPAFVDLIVAVDDGSTDDTWKVLGRLTDKRLTTVRHRTNRGVGAATKTGYRIVLNSQIDLIAVMDGDGQMDGRDLADLLDCAITRADYVKGNRFLDKVSITSMPRLRYLGNRFFSWLARNAAAFDGSVDAHCGYAVVRNQALKRLALDEMYDRYGFPTEMFFAARRAGLVVESVPVKTVYGDEVSGINPYSTIPAILYLIVRGYIRRRRLTKSDASVLAFPPVVADPAEFHLEAHLEA